MKALISSMIVVGAALAAHQPAVAPEVSGIRYTVTFNSETAQRNALQVEMTFQSEGQGPVVLSMPAWTPGSYTVRNFARFVREFEATAGGAPIQWDKADFDSWRVFPSSGDIVTVGFEVQATELAVGMSWSAEDFAFFNGTTAFLYPEGRGFDFPATVSVRTEPDWRVATGMSPGAEPGEFAAGNYHDLVDMPFFIGRFDLDSARVEDRWFRLATYPEEALAGEERATTWEHIHAMMPPMSAVFDDTPFETYTILAVFGEEFSGASALEHSNSYLGYFAPLLAGSTTFASIAAHEIFHAWNVKRLRPEELWPYEYDREQPTTLLWVSEGITDYYDDLALVRGGIISEAEFYASTANKISEVSHLPPVALEDASLSTWVRPTDGTAYIYYPKGSLAGLMLDILIRDATDNRSSLDHVMRELYMTEYKNGSGFSEQEWWSVVSRAVGTRLDLDEFQARYIDGRDAYPWDEVLPLAGIRYVEEEEMLPNIGVMFNAGDEGVHVNAVIPGASATNAGVREGDTLLRAGEIAADGPDWANQFRARYAEVEEGTPVDYVVIRNGSELTLPGQLRFAPRSSHQMEPLPDAVEKAVRIRDGILTGTTD